MKKLMLWFTAVLGLALTVGVTAASSAPATVTSVGPGPPRTVAGFAQSVNPNSSITTGIRHVEVGETVVVSVATGTFAGPVGCSDSSGNTYIPRADKNTGNGRLFVCTSTLTTALPGGAGSTVTATYPGFSGTSVIHAIAVPNSVYSGQFSTGSGSNPPVSTGNVTVGEPSLLVGVVANGNVSSFTPGVDWTKVTPPPTPYFGGSGAGKRTLTTVSRDVAGGTTNLTGNLTGPGFWQAAVISLAAPPSSCTAGSEDFSGFTAGGPGDKPTTFSGGTVDTDYGDIGGVYLQNASSPWHGSFADGTHVLFSGKGVNSFQLTFDNAVKSVELDADPNTFGDATQTLTAYDAFDNVVGTPDSDHGTVADLNHLTVSSGTSNIKYFTIDTTNPDGVGFSNIVWTCN